MAASHKFQHATLSGQSALDAAALLALADEVGKGVTAVTFRGERETWIHCSKRSAQRHDYWVGRSRENKTNKTNLRFVVEAETLPDGPTKLSTSISFFRTSQQMFLGFIPSGPKQLIGYGYYKRFMVNLEDALNERDPQARLEIRERA